MKLSPIKIIVFVLAAVLCAFAGESSDTNDVAVRGWIAKPGISAHPFIAPEFWATNKYRNFYTTRKNWDESGVMGYVERNPALPNVLLIGDSISMGYTLDVRQMLRGKANVYRIPGNGGDTERFLKNYAKYLGAGTNWDLIHFNWGLHDIVRQDSAKRYDSAFKPRYTEAEYSNHLEKCVDILASTGAHLVWASTTPVPPHTAGRVTGDEVTRNAVATAIMRHHGIEIDDLYSLMIKHRDLHAEPSNVHYTGLGYYEMAKQISLVIAHKLGISVNAPTRNIRTARLVDHWRFENNFQDE